MKKSMIVVAAALAALVGGVSIAVAAGEKTDVNYNAKGKFTPKKYKPAQLTFGIGVSTDDPRKILPLKQVNMKFPSKKTMIFKPKKGLKPCKASDDALKAVADRVYQLCAKSVVGNGTATFQLGKKPEQAAYRVGTVVILYGGKVGKNQKIRFSAWSSDTNAGVYAEGILKPNGAMNIAMPVLTADSAVTSLRLNIPGKAISGDWTTSGGKWSLRKGVDKGFARVKCKRGAKLKFSAKFQLGERVYPTGTPTSPTTTSSAKNTSRCGR